MKRIGLLATKTTIRKNLYQHALLGSGIQIFVPDDKIMELHERIIRDVVAKGETKINMKEIVGMTQEFINEKHLDGVILGCTELPLVFPKNKLDNVIDCLDVLADSLLADFYSKKFKKG